MNIQIIQEARPEMFPMAFDRQPPAPAIISIDGNHWSSPVPANAGEAATYNADMDRIARALREAR